MPKYIVQINRKRKSFGIKKAAIEYIENYLDDNYPIDPSKLARIISNIRSEQEIFFGVPLDSKVLVKFYEGRKLIDAISEKEIYIDTLLKDIYRNKGAIHDILEAEGIDMTPFSRLFSMCLSRGTELTEDATLADMRKATLIVSVGMLSHLFEGHMAGEIHSVDELPDFDVPEKKAGKKEDVNRIYG